VSLDWERILTARGVYYATSGRNVSRRNIAVHCPFCGPRDPSEHMSISLEGHGWHCLRDSAHRGRSPARLIAALLQCSPAEAVRIAGTRYLPGDFLSRVRGAVTESEGEEDNNDTPQSLSLPPEFRPLDDSRVTAEPFRAYLRRRGYADEIPFLTSRFDIHYCARGNFAGRVIFPIYARGTLVTWTGRAISRHTELRYMTLGARRGDSPRAVGPITNYLLWHDEITHSGASVLYLVEGPFDALRVRVLGGRGVAATCLFTAGITPQQEILVADLAPRFERRYIMFDEGALVSAMRVQSRLAGLGFGIREVPRDVKDPGELGRRHASWLSKVKI